MLRMNRKVTSNLVLRLKEICAQNRGNSVSGDLKCKNFLGGCPKTPLERIGSGGQYSLSGYLEIFSSYFKILYHMWSFSLFSKSHIGHVNHGKSENILRCW